MASLQFDSPAASRLGVYQQRSAGMSGSEAEVVVAPAAAKAAAAVASAKQAPVITQSPQDEARLKVLYSIMQSIEVSRRVCVWCVWGGGEGGRGPGDSARRGGHSLHGSCVCLAVHRRHAAQPLGSSLGLPA